MTRAPLSVAREQERIKKEVEDMKAVELAAMHQAARYSILGIVKCLYCIERAAMRQAARYSILRIVY